MQSDESHPPGVGPGPVSGALVRKRDMVPKPKSRREPAVITPLVCPRWGRVCISCASTR